MNADSLVSVDITTFLGLFIDNNLSRDSHVERC